MSDTEAIMWAVEKDPALRSDFCNLTILEHAPDDERVAPTLERPPAVGVHADRRFGGRPGRAAAEGSPHDHRRRRRVAPLARVRRLRARSACRPTPPAPAPVS